MFRYCRPLATFGLERSMTLGSSTSWRLLNFEAGGGDCTQRTSSRRVLEGRQHLFALHLGPSVLSAARATQRRLGGRPFAHWSHLARAAGYGEFVLPRRDSPAGRREQEPGLTLTGSRGKETAHPRERAH